MAGTEVLSVEQIRQGAIDPDTDKTTYEYDFLIIGGGSGGLAAAKRAADHGAKVVLCDFVRPSPHGTTWGLGGTCVNVGCIPKKLMHTSAIFGESMKHAVEHFGWPALDVSAKCDWKKLSGNVRDYISSLNFGYRSELGKRKITYINGFCTFVDPHTVTATLGDKKTQTISARRILLATGGRPSLLNCPGVEHAVTSDDIFRLKTDPGKTLVVGASYVALECAGFLTGIGRPATVMVRSIPLRGFDQDMAGKLVQHMEATGTRFIREAVPEKIELSADGKRVVTWRDSKTKEAVSESFDTVLLAIGRTPELANLNLAAAGGIVLGESGKVKVDQFDRTSVPHIYAVGDIVEGGLELTPIAIAAGRHLVDRLYNEGKTVMDYRSVPTTVFTPLEYGCVGLSEEEATKRFGFIEVYHSYFTPLEWQVPHQQTETVHFDNNVCYLKLIVNPFQDEKILGFHVLSPNAGEMTQAVGVAIRMGATKADFDSTIGIHPICAEEMVDLKITKSSGADAKKSGC